MESQYSIIFHFCQESNAADNADKYDHVMSNPFEGKPGYIHESTIILSLKGYIESML